MLDEIFLTWNISLAIILTCICKNFIRYTKAHFKRPDELYLSVASLSVIFSTFPQSDLFLPVLKHSRDQYLYTQICLLLSVSSRGKFPQWKIQHVPILILVSSIHCWLVFNWNANSLNSISEKQSCTFERICRENLIVDNTYQNGLDYKFVPIKMWLNQCLNTIF